MNKKIKCHLAAARWAHDDNLFNLRDDNESGVLEQREGWPLEERRKTSRAYIKWWFRTARELNKADSKGGSK